MSATDAENELGAALGAIRAAHIILAVHRDVLDRLERERQLLENVGFFIAPELYLRAQREPWRKPLNDAVRAALAFDKAITAALAEHERLTEEG